MRIRTSGVQQDDADIEKEVRLTIIGRSGLLRGPRYEGHTWCARTRNDSLTDPPHSVSGSIPLRDTFYAGITHRDFNPRGCLLRAIFPRAAPLRQRRPRPRCCRRRCCLSITANTVTPRRSSNLFIRTRSITRTRDCVRLK